MAQSANYLHRKYKTYEQGLQEYVKWRRSFFPNDWDEEDEALARSVFRSYWNRESLKEGEIHN